jgi:dTDP-glucose 4,6-dehydratase
MYITSTTFKTIAQTTAQQQPPKNRPSHDAHQTINTSKITKELNRSPQEAFDSSIRKIVQWYLDNQDWCQHVLNGSYQSVYLGSEKCTHAN